MAVKWPAEVFGSSQPTANWLAVKWPAIPAEVCKSNMVALNDASLQHICSHLQVTRVRSQSQFSEGSPWQSRDNAMAKSSLEVNHTGKFTRDYR